MIGKNSDCWGEILPVSRDSRVVPQLTRRNPKLWPRSAILLHNSPPTSFSLFLLIPPLISFEIFCLSSRVASHPTSIISRTFQKTRWKEVADIILCLMLAVIIRRSSLLLWHRCYRHNRRCRAVSDLRATRWCQGQMVERIGTPQGVCGTRSSVYLAFQPQTSKVLEYDVVVTVSFPENRPEIWGKLASLQSSDRLGCEKSECFKSPLSDRSSGRLLFNVRFNIKDWKIQEERSQE